MNKKMTLVAEPAKDLALNAGAQSILIDRSQLSRHASGIFFVELRLGNKVATGKLAVTQ